MLLVDPEGYSRVNTVCLNLMLKKPVCEWVCVCMYLRVPLLQFMQVRNKKGNRFFNHWGYNRASGWHIHMGIPTGGCMQLIR